MEKDYSVLKARVRELARDKECVILAHNYQRPEIQECADFVGDSLDLAKRAMGVKEPNMLFCGVDFMAETAVILNPAKAVIVPSLAASCPMAAMLSARAAREAKAAHPGMPLVLYINTLAEAKAEADLICTSSNAVEMVRALPGKEILFGPDANLARFVSARVPEKEIVPVPSDGYCIVHKQLLTAKMVAKMVSFHPRAIVLAHPECNPDVQALADYVLSTNGMVGKARELPETEFIVATERGMVHRLKRELPEKTFYAFEPAACAAMAMNTLASVARALETTGPEVRVPKSVAARARVPLTRMMALSAGTRA